jgi:hypothetical protein
MLGCSPNKAQDTTACEMQTLRFYAAGSGDDFMIQCMAAKGYEFDVLPEECDNRTRMVMQSACYKRLSWTVKFGEALGLFSNRNK